MTKSNDKLKRKRSRPSSTPADVSSAPGSYNGPSLDDIIRLTDAQVLASFKELGVEPHPFRWNEDDNQRNVALWHDYGMTMTDADWMRTAPAENDKAAMKALKDSSFAIYQCCLRMELMRAYIHHWVVALDDSQLVAQVERLSDDKLSASEKRYAKRADLQERVASLVWPDLVNASKLYVPVPSPLTT